MTPCRKRQNGSCQRLSGVPVSPDPNNDRNSAPERFENQGDIGAGTGATSGLGAPSLGLAPPPLLPLRQMPLPASTRQRFKMAD